MRAAALIYGTRIDGSEATPENHLSKERELSPLESQKLLFDRQATAIAGELAI